MILDTTEVLAAIAGVEAARTEVARVRTLLDNADADLTAAKERLSEARLERDAPMPHLVIQGQEFVLSRRTEASVWLRLRGDDEEVRFTRHNRVIWVERGKRGSYFDPLRFSDEDLMRLEEQR